MSFLSSLGFSSFFSSQCESLSSSLSPARVVGDRRGALDVLGCGPATAVLSGRLRHELSPEQRPVTGDWVLVDDRGSQAVVQRVLDRRTVLRRKSAGTTSSAQVLAANVDVFFVVTSAEGDLSARRLERYLAAVWDGGAQPVIVVNKVDLVADPREALASVASVARDAPFVAVSAVDGSGLDALEPWLVPATTVALVGSSGVGKSSLINKLRQREGDALPEASLRVGAIDDVGRGRHTTTGRSLIALDGGVWLMDTPGVREFGAIDDGEGLQRAFSDIESLAAGCRFRDCRHEREPGCAVRAAVDAGALEPERVDSRHKLEREARASAARHDHAIASANKRRFKEIARSRRSLERARRDREG